MRHLDCCDCATADLQIGPRVRRVSFDAVLIISFGGPQGLDDIRPFLANVLRGRQIPPARIDEVAHHYELFGGISPLTAFTMKQACGRGSSRRVRGFRSTSGCAIGIPT